MSPHALTLWRAGCLIAGSLIALTWLYIATCRHEPRNEGGDDHES